MNIDNHLRNEMRRFPIRGSMRAAAYAVYLYIIINASFKDGAKTNRGQLLTSTLAIARALELSERKVRTAVDKLIAAKLITKKSTRQYTIFTILNYDRDVRRQKEQSKKTVDESKRIADQKYYEYLLKEIQKRELNDEEKKFFNNYYTSELGS